MSEILDLDAALDEAAETNDLKDESDEFEAELHSKPDDVSGEEQVEEAAEEAEDASEEAKPESTEEGKAPEEKAKTEEADEETFTHVDPATLPEELKPVYKSLLRDYTQKRQAEAAEKKELSEENARLKREVEQARQQPAAQGQPTYMGLTPEQFAQMKPADFAKYALEYAKGQANAEREEQYAAEAQAEFVALDARLNRETSAFNPYMARYVAPAVDEDLQAYMDENGTMLGFDYKASAAKHIAEWETWIKNERKQTVKDTATASKAHATSVRKQAPPTSTANSKSNGKMGIDDAIAEAFNQQ